MERCVTFTVDASGGVTPTAPQYAGVQGEHNACRVVFAVAAWATEEFHYRGEFVSGDGAGGSTEELIVTDGAVSFLLPAAWTAAGGRAVVRLVASVLVNGEEEQTVFAVDAPVYFAAKQELGAEIRATEMAGLAGLIQTVQDTVADVEDRLARDAFKGDKGDTGPVGPKGDPWVYIGSGEMPEGYDVQIDPDGDATTDATLCIAGYPADAKATGDRLAQKLDADALDDAVEQALQEAKESGAFKGDPGEDLTEKEWVLIESVTLDEAVSSYVATIPKDTYKEVFIEGVLNIETEVTAATAIQLSVGRAGVGVVAMKRSLSNGKKLYCRAHGWLSPAGRQVYDMSLSLYAYTDMLFYRNPGDMTTMRFDHFNDVRIWLSGTTHFFGAGSTINVWGR